MGDKSSSKSSKRSRDEPVAAVEDAPVKADKKSKSSKKAKADEPMPDADPSAPIVDEPVASTSAAVPSEATDAAPAEGADEAEVPALSHKEKRLAKRRKLAGIPEREPAPAAAAPAKAAHVPIPGTIGAQAPLPAVGATPAKGAFGIWVGNMNFATPSKDLLAWFENRGLREITRINMPNGKRVNENNRGFAYLDFPSATDVEIAVGLSEQHLDGRKLLIKSSSDFSGRPNAPASSVLPTLDPSALVPESDLAGNSAPTAGTSNNGAPGQAPQTLNRTARKILDRQRNPPAATLFIGNLGFETKADDIRNLFDAHQKQQAEWAPRVTKTKEERIAEREAAKAEREKAKKDEDRDSDDSDSDDDDDDEEEKPKKEKKVKSEDDEDDAEEKDSDAESEDEDAKPKEKAKRVRVKKDKNAPLDLSKAKDAGIRKIRLGTFEDTGKCKGWAFVDFHLTAQATRALLNIRNHHLDGRDLKIEYGSADAVRRGAIGTKAARGQGGQRPAPRGEQSGRTRVTPKGKDWDDADVRESAKRDYFDDPEQPQEKKFRSEFGFRPTQREGAGGGDRPPRVQSGRPAKEGAPRAKPGAALASAQRASEGIVQSTGKKIVF